MERLKTLLIANRGEIACRCIKTARKLNIRTIAIYTEADATSLHVREADIAVLLPGGNAKGYLDGEAITQIAKTHGAEAIIPGYGFLSENADFARKVGEDGLVWVGPRPESIESFGIKHTARDLAAKAGVPIVPGSDGLIESENHAVVESQRLGFPIMLKATAGGGGMGLATCNNVEEVKEAYATVKSRGETLFKNAGMFMERYYPESHHVEVQVFGNGLGKAVHYELRERICSAAVRLAESIKYCSAGTIEYLVDDHTASFFFLEMNTRLQVEHGITELCYDVDLVEFMLRQADAQLLGRGGIDVQNLQENQPSKPHGAAIQARVYAENPARDYAPSPGTLQLVEWKGSKHSFRLDTWVQTGTIVSSYYDPLLAKIMVHSENRSESIEGIRQVLASSRICGPPTNLDFLACIVSDSRFEHGNTMTRFLNEFQYEPAAVEVISGGAYTTVQDYPGRPNMGRGFPHSGPMDPVAFQIANILVGNTFGTESLECTLDGPELRFLCPTIVSVCGASMEIFLNGKAVSMWSTIRVEVGQILEIGKTSSHGCRAYLAIRGGLPSIAEWFHSKATSPGVGVGGYQGRALASGDQLALNRILSDDLQQETTIPANIIPTYSNHWKIQVMMGPYSEGFLTDEDIKMIYTTKWQVSHNAARGGIRLVGPKPKFARPDGGEGGAHPSNVAEYGYPVGTLNWTGDDPCIFPVDCPDFGGFISSTTIIKADYWKMGQMRAGDTLELVEVSYGHAVDQRERVNAFIDELAKACSDGDFSKTMPLQSENPGKPIDLSHTKAVIHSLPSHATQPSVSYRQGGDSYILVEYGQGAFDLNHRCRVTSLTKALRDSSNKINFSNSYLINTVGCCNSLLIYFDPLKVHRSDLLSFLTTLEGQIGDLSQTKVPSRIFKLPILFNSSTEKEATKRYMETQRPYASYLPDNMEFVAKNNGLSKQNLVDIYLKTNLIAVSVGFFAALPLCLPIDPRNRINCPKYNPSRVFTPEGQVSWGGSCMALYNVESPGGYQMTGNTIPGCDILGSKKGYSLERPWLFEDFDQLTFYEVEEKEYQRQLGLFHSGRYEYEVEDTVFDMGEHNRLLESTREEVRATRCRQRRAQDEMQKTEGELMAKWMEEKAKGKVPVDQVEALLHDAGIRKITSPLNANVWKIVVEEGDLLEEGMVVAVLEAMKLEINVGTDKDSSGEKVEKIVARPGDVVNAGDVICLVRSEGAKTGS